jgi:alpha-beta hydrolase superfamily lysophospholipase
MPGKRAGDFGPHIDRRSVLISGGIATAFSLPPVAAIAADGLVAASEYWVDKGDVRLAVYRKRLVGQVQDDKRPVLFLVHGSTASARGSYDLQVPGRHYSMMDEFARRGFDVWTVDHEGYGRSTHSGRHCGIMVGVEDLRAVMPLVEKTTGRNAVMMYGHSSGAIRAGAFAASDGNRVERLILDAFTYTGTNAPEIDRRRREVEKYRKNPSRPVSMQSYLSIFNRDKPGTYEQVVAQVQAESELKFGDSVPSGTYLDMAENLPLVDPRQVQCPVCLLRAEHDGNASEAELLEFFTLLPNRDRQFVFLAGTTHVGTLGLNRHRIWHVMAEFLTYPEQRSG